MVLLVAVVVVVVVVVFFVFRCCRCCCCYCYSTSTVKYLLLRVILNEQFTFLFPSSSLALYNTSVELGTPYFAPDCLLEVTMGGFPELSVNVGLSQFTLIVDVVALSMVMSDGQLPTTGGSVSIRIKAVGFSINNQRTYKGPWVPETLPQ